MEENKHESTSAKRGRNILSFFLYVFLVILSVAICAKVAFFNDSSINKHFTDYEYINGLRNNIIEYTNDYLAKNGVSCDEVEDAITYDTTQNIVQAYIGYYTDNEGAFSEDTYESYISDAMAQLDSTLKENGYDNIDTSKIENYFISQVELDFIDRLPTIINIANIASVVIIVVCAVVSLLLTLGLLSVGEKKYRNIRCIAYSFLASGVMNFIFALMAFIIILIKHIHLYPVYLQNTFMSYVYGCIISVIVVAAMCVGISLAFQVVVWRMRKNGSTD